MEADNQHLDFLISQYVDGCLEGADKKLVEQKMLGDPAARKLYAEHRETQDFLDDWGNRIPLINWEEFDQKLAARLEVDAQEKERVSLFQRRMKPWAAAAALFVAASLGYGWHALSHEKAVVVAPGGGAVVSNVPRARVEFPDMTSAKAPSHASLGIVEQGPAGTGVSVGNASVVSAPADATAFESLKANVEFGFNHLTEGAQPRATPVNSAVAVDVPATRKDDGDAPR